MYFLESYILKYGIYVLKENIYLILGNSSTDPILADHITINIPLIWNVSFALCGTDMGTMEECLNVSRMNASVYSNLKKDNDVP